jgi:hypothetical protein
MLCEIAMKKSFRLHPHKCRKKMHGFSYFPRHYTKRHIYFIYFVYILLGIKHLGGIL